METIKTSTETIITSGNETWEDLGETKLLDSYNHYYGRGRILYKNIPGLGPRFKIVCNNNCYAVKKLRSLVFGCNVRVGDLYYASIEGMDSL